MRRHPAETGFRLAIPKAKPIRLDDAMSIRAAFASITHTCTVHVVASADYARKSDNPEGIHQLRVGIRRVRAAFSIFRQIEPSRRRPAIIGKLHALQQKLGAAREWDVLIEETIGSMPRQLRNGQALRNLLKIAEVKRAQGHQRARAALEDPRCADLLLQLQSWIDNHFGLRPSRNDPETDPLARQVAGFAAEVLGIRHAKARRLGKKIRKLENQELHQLRIRIKKLRYAVEFFRDLWPSRRAERYLSALKKLQQVLGTAHDATIALSLLATLPINEGKDTEHAATLVHDWAAACYERDRKELIDLWRRFAKHEGFWKSKP